MIKVLLKWIVKLFLGTDPTKEQVDKILSARFLMAIFFSASYCLIVILCTYAMVKKVLSVETGVALIGAFALVVREIVSDYFQREDRQKEVQK